MQAPNAKPSKLVTLANSLIGRNVDECENTFESLVQHNELPAHNPNAPYTPGGSQSMRRAPAPGSFYAPSTRVIKPKPQYGANGGTPQQPYSGKKRGRPSKADLERRAQEAAAVADDGGMTISIGADGAVVAGQKRKMGEGDGEDEEHDLVQQAQGALAMPAAMMQVEGQPPVKRGRGRPRKIRPEEVSMLLSLCAPSALLILDHSNCSTSRLSSSHLRTRKTRILQTWAKDRM